MSSIWRAPTAAPAPDRLPSTFPAATGPPAARRTPRPSPASAAAIAPLPTPRSRKSSARAPLPNPTAASSRTPPSPSSTGSASAQAADQTVSTRLSIAARRPPPPDSTSLEDARWWGGWQSYADCYQPHVGVSGLAMHGMRAQITPLSPLPRCERNSALGDAESRRSNGGCLRDESRMAHPYVPPPLEFSPRLAEDRREGLTWLRSKLSAV
jgi:hypothetical protein